MKIILPVSFLFSALPLIAQTDAQESPLDHVQAEIETQASFATTDHTPFWHTANRYGLSSVTPNNGYLRFKFQRPVVVRDSLRNWHFGYGLDVAVLHRHTEDVVLQQAFVSAQYKLSRFTLGQEQRSAAINHAELSTGSFVFGTNARPVPMLRWELHDWWNISGHKHWAAIKMHIGYGIETDGGWIDRNQKQGGYFAKGAVHHEKAGFLRLGNPDRSDFTFIGGLEMATQTGGYIYNKNGQGQTSFFLNVGYDPSLFWHALKGKGGSDATDGQGYGNSAGNSLGAWKASFNYRSRRHHWGARFYYDHYFEDDSAAFDEYGWLDGLFGLEVNLPTNRILSDIVLEHVRMDYQSGPLYHDHTPQLPDQISGVDNYYNHGLYLGWQNYGMAMGNALFASPMYGGNGDLFFRANRFRANHIGLAGSPSSHLNYRLLYTHLWSWGRYAAPFDEVEHQHSFLAEVSCRLGKHATPWLSDWNITASVAADRGVRLGRNFGVQLTISKRGVL